MRKYATLVGFGLTAIIFGCGSNSPSNGGDPAPGPEVGDSAACHGFPQTPYCVSRLDETGAVDPRGPFMELYFYLDRNTLPASVCGTIETRGDYDTAIECTAPVSGSALGTHTFVEYVWSQRAGDVMSCAKGGVLSQYTGESGKAICQGTACSVSNDVMQQYVSQGFAGPLQSAPCDETPSQFCVAAYALNLGLPYYGDVTSCETDKYTDKDTLIAAVNKVQGRDAFTVPLCRTRPVDERAACTDPGDTQSLPSELEKFRALVEASPADRDALCQANAVATAARLKDYLATFSTAYNCGF